MQIIIENIIYTVTSEQKRTARVGGNTSNNNNAVNGTISKNILFKEFVEIENKRYEVTEIGARSFRWNMQIERVIFHQRIRIIDTFAFDQCNNLVEVSFSEGSKLEKLGYASFYNTSFRSIIFPFSLKTILGHTFCFCSKLELVVFYGKNEITESIFDYSKTLPKPTPENIQIIVSSLYKFDKFGKRDT